MTPAAIIAGIAAGTQQEAISRQANIRYLVLNEFLVNKIGKAMTKPMQPIIIETKKNLFASF